MSKKHSPSMAKAVSLDDLRGAPREVLLDTIKELRAENARLAKRVELLDAKAKKNSSNSSKPSSSDNPYKNNRGTTPPKSKPGARPGHKGHRQTLLEPTLTQECKPEECCYCGCTDFQDTKPFYTHQVLELPKIELDVTHFILHRGQCPNCGKINKGKVPGEHSTGYGPRLSAVIAELAGAQGDSRTTVQQFCSSVLNFSISRGTIQKVIDRVSASILSHYEAIGEVARTSTINHVDETSWRNCRMLCWLWVLTNTTVAFFMIHTNRSGEAFRQLIKDWEGILISDGYKVYQSWVGLRQTCLSHLIRDAKGLAERSDPELAKFGKWATAELQRLCHMAHAPPTRGEWNVFYARFIRLISLYHEQKNEAGVFARRLNREMDSLWVFLVEAGVSPTNNHAERMIRFAVLWRKRSLGTYSDKGCRWAERIITLRQTCRLHGRPTYPVLVEAIDCYFKGETPSLPWLEQA